MLTLLLDWSPAPPFGGMAVIDEWVASDGDMHAYVRQGYSPMPNEDGSWSQSRYVYWEIWRIIRNNGPFGDTKVHVAYGGYDHSGTTVEEAQAQAARAICEARRQPGDPP